MMKCAICKCIGRYHEENNGVCQDSISKYKNDDKYCVVLADGAGSIKNSEEAANYVTNVLSKYLSDNFERLYLMEEDDIKDDVLNYLNINSNVLLNCTCLAICSTKDKNLILHIGDGLILGYKDTWKLVSGPDNGEDDSITFFLSSKYAKKHLRVYKDNYKLFFLCSDGLSSLIYNNNKIQDAVNILSNWLIEYSEEDVEKKLLEECERLFKKYSYDDISFGILVKGEEG